MTDTTPHPGLTTTPTGYPSSVFRGLHLTRAEVAEQQGRSDKRRLADGRVPRDSPHLSTKAVPRDTVPVRTLHPCKHCGTSFVRRTSQHRYCSPDCVRDAAKVRYENDTRERECRWCRKAFTAYRSRSNGGYAVTCSRRCATLWGFHGKRREAA